MAHSGWAFSLGLTQMWPLDGRETVRDIIAIHGLDTRSPRTWVAYEDETIPGSRLVHWLKDEDMLPAEVGDSRIFTYDWNANTFQSASSQYFQGHAEDFLHHLKARRRGNYMKHPLIFIASCYGGLVLAKAFAIAGSLKSHEDIYNSISGILFLGTPFRGSKGTNSAHKWVAFSSRLGKQTSRKLLDVLDEDRLREIRTQFCDQAAEKWGSEASKRVICFYETETTRILRAALPKSRQLEKAVQMMTGDTFNFVLVESDSACLDGFGREAMNVRHAMLNKFRGRDNGFNAVVAHIKYFADNPALGPVSRDSSSPMIDKRSNARALTPDEQRCLQLLRVSDYRWYKDMVETRLAGTCQWFTKHRYYQTWKASQSGVLVVSADPGCGKSVLAKFLVDEELSRSSTICYFFFKEMDQNTNNQAFCSILHQLFESRPELIKYALEHFATSGNKLGVYTSVLWDILVKTTSDPNAGQVICVLDALDEGKISEMQELVRYITQLYRRNHGAQLKFLITTRPYENVTSGFGSLETTFPSVRIRGEEEGKAISEEIYTVIQHRITALSLEKMLSPSIETHLRKRMTEIQHRTYLWMHLVFDYLQHNIIKKTLNGVDEVVDKLPQSVEEAYSKLLKRSHPSARREVRKALLIIVGAFRPLYLHEFNNAMGIIPQVKHIDKLDLEGDVDFKLRIRDWCGLFVSIYDERAYLIHQTAREFLLRLDSLDGSLTWLLPFNPRETDGQLAEICILLLNYQGLVQDNRNRRRDLSNYATIYWPDHVRGLECLPSSLQTLYECLLRRPGDRVTGWLTHWATSGNHRLLIGHSYKERFERELESYSTLALQALMGHFSELQRALPPSVDQEQSNQLLNKVSGVSPLYASVLGGQPHISHYLLQHGADPNDVSFQRVPLLYWIATQDYPDGKILHECISLFETLITKGADVKRANYESISILQATSIKDFARIACEHGADPNRQSGPEPRQRSPLYQARNLEIVKTLLTGGADANAVEGPEQETALHKCHTDPDIIEALVKAGCPVNGRNIFGKTPIHYALSDICALTLIRLGGDVNAGDLFGRTVLHNGSKIARCLIENGADLNARDRDGKTPLMVRVSNGDLNSVEMLLNAGADIALTCQRRRSCLHYTCLPAEYGAKEDLYGEPDDQPNLVGQNEQWLLEDVLLKPNLNEGAPDDWLFDSDDNDDVELEGAGILSDHGAEDEDVFHEQPQETNCTTTGSPDTREHDVYSNKEHVGSVQASRNEKAPGAEDNGLDDIFSGNLDLSQFEGVMESGSDSEFGVGGDPYDHEEDNNVNILLLLIQTGASIQEKDFEGNTPLHCLCIRGTKGYLDSIRVGKEALAHQLISAGADVKVKNNAGLTPLQVAVNSGQSDRSFDRIIELLQEQSTTVC